MATAQVVEVPEINVTGQLIPIQEFDKIRSTVCLLKPSDKYPGRPWTASGFFINVKLKKGNKTLEGYFIITNYHVLQEKEENSDMVAVFHHDSTEQKPIEIPLVPFSKFASSEELDYVLIRIDPSLLRSFGIKPVLADANKLPNVQKNDIVYIIQHPGGMMKHFSQDAVKRVNKPFLEYYADTLKGSSGSPVFVLEKSKFSLVALHSKGVESYPSNWNKGVLLSEILNHLQTGKVTKPSFPSNAVPAMIESGSAVPVVGSKDPSLKVTKEDIRLIAKDVTEEFWTLGSALGISDSTLKIINANNRHDAYQRSYQMLTKWTQIKVSDANYGALSKAFAHPTVERQDLIGKYC